MALYLTWINEAEILPAYPKEDLKAVSLTISQKEGEVALAYVVVDAWGDHSIPQEWIAIMRDDRLIFRGRLLSSAESVMGDMRLLRFSAVPMNASEQLTTLLRSHQESPLWDPLFVEIDKRNDPVEILENQPMLFNWDRRTSQVILSSYIEGRHHKDISGLYLRDSLTLQNQKIPLSCVHVDVIAEWTQQGGGEINLGHRLAAYFPGGMIHTLTGNALKGCWPKEGYRLKQSGYVVVEASLKAIVPSILLYPRRTPALQFDKDRRLKRLQYHFFEAELTLAYQISQKRREIASFTLGRGGKSEKKLRLCLQDITEEGFNPALNSFFLTERGQRAIAHAIDIAYSHLVGRSRSMSIQVDLPWEHALDISLDHSVTIRDPRLPEGGATGKVMAYTFYRDGHTEWVRMTIGVAQEISTAPLEDGVSEFYADDDYGNINCQPIHKTPGGRLFRDYMHQIAEGPWDVNALTHSDVVRKIHVRGDGSTQAEYLLNHQYPLRQNLESTLHEIPTEIDIELTSLKTVATLEHTIHVTVA